MPCLRSEPCRAYGVAMPCLRSEPCRACGVGSAQSLQAAVQRRSAPCGGGPAHQKILHPSGMHAKRTECGSAGAWTRCGSVGVREPGLRCGSAGTWTRCGSVGAWTDDGLRSVPHGAISNNEKHLDADRLHNNLDAGRLHNNLDAGRLHNLKSLDIGTIALRLEGCLWSKCVLCVLTPISSHCFAPHPPHPALPRTLHSCCTVQRRADYLKSSLDSIIALSGSNAAASNPDETRTSCGCGGCGGCGSKAAASNPDKISTSCDCGGCGGCRGC
eukprot:350758-Chlamydomonas_euryale.AAC.8